MTRPDEVLATSSDGIDHVLNKRDSFLDTTRHDWRMPSDGMCVYMHLRGILFVG